MFAAFSLIRLSSDPRISCSDHRLLSIVAVVVYDRCQSVVVKSLSRAASVARPFPLVRFTVRFVRFTTALHHTAPFTPATCGFYLPATAHHCLLHHHHHHTHHCRCHLPAPPQHTRFALPPHHCTAPPACHLHLVIVGGSYLFCGSQRLDGSWFISADGWIWFSENNRAVSRSSLFVSISGDGCLVRRVFISRSEICRSEISLTFDEKVHYQRK